MFPKLFSVSATGAERYWVIKVVKNDDDSATIIREYGQVSGKAQFAETHLTEGKSKKTAYDQAIFEANSLWKAQVEKKGMIEKKTNEKGIVLPNLVLKTKSSVDGKGKQEEINILPMLAKSYADAKQHIKFPCYIQPKLDGIRYTARKLSSSIELRTRQSKIKPFFDHIRDEIEKLSLPDNIILDGEFYSLSIQFKTLNGYCNITKQESYDNIPEKELLSIRYNIFDCYDLKNPQRTFQERYEYLKTILPEDTEFLSLVKCEVIESDKGIHEWHDKYVSQGYEGIMIRNSAGKYRLNYRSSDLLKLKNFIDEEYTIVAAETPKTGKDEGAIIFILETNDGAEFTCRPRGTIEDRIREYQDYLDNKKNYIGKKYTVRFQEKYENGIPRFPVGIAIRYDLD